MLLDHRPDIHRLDGLIAEALLRIVGQRLLLKHIASDANSAAAENATRLLFVMLRTLTLMQRTRARLMAGGTREQLARAPGVVVSFEAARAARRRDAGAARLRVL